jgi:hypothetical protein
MNIQKTEKYIKKEAKKMNRLYNYKQDLKIKDDYKTNGYYKKTFILKCFDEKQEQNFIEFSIYYGHYCYIINIYGLKIENVENGFIESFVSDEPIQLEMEFTSYHFSKKLFEKTEIFLLTNLNRLLKIYCNMNKNIDI